MATREKGKKKIKHKAPQEASRQFKVTDPISMVDLEKKIYIQEEESTLANPLLSDQRLGKWPKKKRRKECLKKKRKDP